MKKLIAITLMAAMAVMTVGPALSTATVTTVTPNYSGSGGGSDIFVKGKWEMKGPSFDAAGNYVGYSGGEGRDDSTAAGAQFNAPGVWGDTMDYTVCAIVRGPNDYIDNIRNVYAEIYYPIDRPMHASGFSDCYGSYPPGGTSNDDPVEIDNPSWGCGAHIEQNNLHRLDQQDGWDLVCGALYTYNRNLPKWASNYDPGAEWEELCGAEGELTKSWAAVYCSDKDITWEDPAGDYRVTVTAYDNEDNQSNVLENHFTYQEKQGFEIDFDTVDYGVVSISEHTMIAGDKCFWPGDSDIPTIRNTGNTRLNIKIAQDDMGLGRTDPDYVEPDIWRPEYDARVGDLYANMTTYLPFDVKGETPDCGDYTPLDGEILDLSEIEEMDFSIHVREKWPLNLDSYSGSMWLSADRADFDTDLCID